MIVVIESPVEREHLRAALEGYVHKRGVNEVPDALVGALEALRSHPTPFAANLVDALGSSPDDELMTFPQAAELVHVSTSTLRRWVSEDRLQKVGRKLRRGDVLAVVRGEQ